MGERKEVNDLSGRVDGAPGLDGLLKINEKAFPASSVSGKFVRLLTCFCRLLPCRGPAALSVRSMKTIVMGKMAVASST